MSFPFRRPSTASSAAKFICVGAFGFIVQLGALWLLTARAHWGWLPATIAAVELTILHNFVWHDRWTWGARVSGITGRTTAERLLRFNASTALTSIAGNVAMMAVLVGAWRLPPVAANVIAVAAMSVANFVIADRWVFVGRRAAMFACLAACVALPATAFAEPSPEALDAWNQYVAQVETRLALENAQPLETDFPAADGETIAVEDGTISHWRGSVFLRGVTVDELLDRLQHPGTPPPQEDVTAARVLARGPDSLRVYIRLVRHAIVTVSYDTEHEMTFRRVSPTRAIARSVATRIDEVGGGDKGFLWRLNSYWRYEQAEGGTVVQLESLTLSRGVPLFIRPFAGRIVPRIARESIVRTLEALRRYAETLG